MIEEPAIEEPAEGGDGQAPEHRMGAFRSLFVSALDAVRTRLDLAAVEAEMFVLRTIRLLLWAFAAVACALLALVFVIVAVVAALWDAHRMLGVLGGAALFVVLAAVFGLLAGRSLRARPQMLESTLAQLEVDRNRAGGVQ